MEKIRQKINGKLILIVSLLFVVLVFGAVLVGCNKKDPSLSLNKTFKTEYVLLETLDVSGGELLYTDENGEETIVNIKESFVTGFDTSTVGVKELTVTYKDLSIKIEYSVVPQFMQYNTYYEAVSLTDQSYNYIRLISEDNIEFINNAVPNFANGYKRNFSITSKSLENGKWVIMAESTDSPMAKCVITVENPLKLTANLYTQDNEIVDSLQFTNLVVPEYMEINSYYKSKSALDESYNFVKLVSDTEIEFVNRPEEDATYGNNIKFIIQSKIMKNGQWFVVAESEEQTSTIQMQITVVNSSTIYVGIFTNQTLIEQSLFQKID